MKAISNQTRKGKTRVTNKILKNEINIITDTNHTETYCTHSRDNDYMKCFETKKTSSKRLNLCRSTTYQLTVECCEEPKRVVLPP